MNDIQAAKLKGCVFIGSILVLLFWLDWQKTLLALALITAMGAFAFAIDRVIDWARSSD